MSTGPVLDGTGRPVPDCLADVFGDPTVKQWVGSLRACQKELAALCRDANEYHFSMGELYPHCGLGDASDDLRQLIQKLTGVGDGVEGGLPHAVCRGCNGHGCHTCRCGYTTKQEA